MKNTLNYTELLPHADESDSTKIVEELVVELNYQNFFL